MLWLLISVNLLIIFFLLFGRVFSVLFNSLLENIILTLITFIMNLTDILICNLKLYFHCVSAQAAAIVSAARDSLTGGKFLYINSAITNITR